jgi:oxygen-dependent protoporphyrinogen oxidase
MASRVIVVGAGIAGLTAAFRLQARGHQVRVLEGEEVVGGKMVASRGDGWVINRGAQLLPASYDAALALARDAGAGADLRPFVATLSILRDGTEHQLRGAGLGMAVDGLRTDLLSWRSKLLLRRAALDAIRMRRALDYEAHAERARWDTESIADYCARRLNDEIRDYVIDPLMRGLFLSDAQQMSIVDFYFTAARLLGAKLLLYPAGLDFLPRALARSLDVHTSARVSRVERTDGGVAVTLTDRVEEADGCVIAMEGPATAAVYPGLDPRRRDILTREMEQTAVYGLHFGTSHPIRDDVVAITIPRREREGLGTITFQHVYMPHCVPPGKGLVSAWWDNDWCSARETVPDEDVIAEMLPIVETVVPGVGAAAEFTRLDRWSPATPLGRVGNHVLAAELDRLADTSGRVQLAGDYLSLATINGAVVSGEAAARRLHAMLTSA